MVFLFNLNNLLIKGYLGLYYDVKVCWMNTNCGKFMYFVVILILNSFKCYCCSKVL